MPHEICIRIMTNPTKRLPADRGQGRPSLGGAGKSPVLQVPVPLDLKIACQTLGMSWVRDVLKKAVLQQAPKG